MAVKFTRCPENPVVQAGLYPWRMCLTMNPGALYDDGKFYLYERAAPGLRPFYCYIGMLESDDGVHFKHVSDQPVLTPEMCGSKYGSVQDARTVKIGDTYYMTFAFRPYTWSMSPTGLGVPDGKLSDFEGLKYDEKENQTRSGVAVSQDRVHWRVAGWVNPLGTDDRNVILFPEKLNGRFAVLRRPSTFVSADAKHADNHPRVCISYSDDLANWSEPKVVIEPKFAWEDNRIGGSTPPIKTKHGWLVTYHGVQNLDSATRRVVYRMGALMLDLNDPTKTIARSPEPIFQPEEYYERFGLFIPNVVFPTGGVVKDGLLYLYYGCCDTAIGLATVKLQELVDHVMQYPV